MTRQQPATGSLVDALMDAWEDGAVYSYTKEQMQAVIDNARAEAAAPQPAEAVALAAKALADATSFEHSGCTYDTCQWCRLADDVHAALANQPAAEGLDVENFLRSDRFASLLVSAQATVDFQHPAWVGIKRADAIAEAILARLAASRAEKEQP